MCSVLYVREFDSAYLPDAIVQQCLGMAKIGHNNA